MIPSGAARLVAASLAAALTSCGGARAVLPTDPGKQRHTLGGERIVSRELRVSAAADTSDPFAVAAERADAAAARGDDESHDPDLSSAALGTTGAEPDVRPDAGAAKGGSPGTSRPRSPRDGAPKTKAPAGTGDSLFETDLGIEDLASNPVALKSWAGKLTVVNVWATWCGPCRTETPELVKLARDLEPRGVKLVGVALDGDAVEVRAFMRSYGIEYPMAIGRKKFVTAMGSLGISVHGVPLTLLLDTEGRVLESYLGMIHRPAIEADVERHLK